MVLGVDTDVLVHWVMQGAPHHRATRRFFQEQLDHRGRRLGLTQQVLCEFLHVSTDPRRFQNPLAMSQALDLTRDLWSAEEVERIVPTPAVYGRVTELMERLRLGRKRVLDTALAATLESAGVSLLATFNGQDFQVFSFLDIVNPGQG